MSETGRKLEQNAAQLFRLCKRGDAGFEFLYLVERALALLMGELLPGFQSELEVVRRTLDPAFGHLLGAWPIKRRIDFDGVEVARIKLKLIRFRKRIKNAGPGTGACI